MFNIFILAFLAVAAGIVLSVWITRQPREGTMSMVPPEEDFDRDVETGEGNTLTREDLFRLGESLCKENGLLIKDKITQSENEVYWVAESNNNFFYGLYVLAFYETDKRKPFISLPTLFEFKDFVKSVGSNKGFLFTNGYFTRDVHQPLEGAKVALYNKKKVLEELRVRNLLLSSSNR